MNNHLVDEIANAVLYEGYLLYPYRASAVKNRQRWNFGVLYPRAYSEAQQGADAWSMQTECLVVDSGNSEGAFPTLSIRLRFLHLVSRSTSEPAQGSGQTWQEAIEREVSIPSINLGELATSSLRQIFAFPAGSEKDGTFLRKHERVEGAIEVETEDVGPGLLKVRVRIFNLASLACDHRDRDENLLQSLVSTHTILHVNHGEFISLLDPPEELRALAATCKNSGAWPVLAGEEGQRDTMLSSPIILYDYPQIAPESAGALFDGTEIDEILTLRIMTLTDEEKLEMREADNRARQILERTESMPAEQLMKMHGALRGLREVQQRTS